MRQLTALLLIWLAAFPLLAQQLKVEAPTDVDVNEYFHLRFMVNTSDASDFTPPSLSDFDILAGPSVSQSSNYQIVNGRASSSSSVTYTYVLSPRKTGAFTIGAASVKAGGHTLHSRTVSIRVTGNGKKQGVPSQHGAPNGNDDPDVQLQKAGSRISERDLYLTVTPSRTKVFEQEAVLLTYKVHVRNGIGLSNVMLSQKPDFKGIVSQEIPVNSISTHSEGGYRVGKILQYVIFPQQSGRLEVPSISFDCTVVQEGNFSDPIDAFFNGGGAIGVKVSRKVAPTTINVTALPQPKPANYSGGVGKFSIKGELISPAPKSNDIATYRITLSGTGNLKLITAPNVSFPKDFDAYEPKTNEHTNITADGLTGQMTYEYTFIPRNVGKYTIPAIEFCYFNPSSGKYETLRTAPVTLDVKQGERTNQDVERELALRNSDIRPIVEGDVTAIDPQHPFWWGTWSYWLVHLLLIVAALLLYVQIGKRIKAGSDLVGTRRRKAGSVAQKRLKKAEKLLQGNDDAFYYELSLALQGYLADKFNLPQAEMSHERIKSLLDGHDIPAETAALVTTSLEECEFARFAPTAGSDTKSKLYASAVRAIDTLEKAGVTRRKAITPNVPPQA